MRTRNDPAPCTGPQLRALGAATCRELGWGLRVTRREVARWQRLAEAIPDPELRADALESLVVKRTLVEGTARFWTIPDVRHLHLLRALVAFQVMADFLDIRSERMAGSIGGERLMRAYVDAVDVECPLGDYYEDRPGTNDGGYLRQLVSACRSSCTSLPRYAEARPLLARHAQLARSLDLHHDPDPQRRTERLAQFATSEIEVVPDALWIEQAAGPSSALTVIALLALAADPGTTVEDLHATVRAYAWISSLSMMLDSYADQLDDAVSGNISFIAYYPSQQAAVERIGVLIDRALREVRELRNGERHALLVSMMVALFLSRDGARDEQLLDGTRELVRSSGSLTRLLVPVLRVWRIGYRQRSG